MTRHLKMRSTLTKKLLSAGIAATVAAGVLVPATGAGAAGCGFLGLFPCGTTAQRVPGTPVTPVQAVNRSPANSNNVKVGHVPDTAALGVMDAGVVPVVGDVNAKSDDGAYVLYEKLMDDRTVDLMVQSPALNGPAAVRVMLPKTWLTTPSATYPVMYLLTGGYDNTDYQTWSYNTHIEDYTANTNALVVMPAVGVSGFGTDYWNFGLGQALGNQYDKFLAVELPQILKRGYRAGAKSVLAGISSGGYSVFALPMRHPGQYSVAASFSGVPDTQASGVPPLLEVTLPLVMLQVPLAMWGSSIGMWWIWDANNPAKHMDKLKGLKMIVTAGDGKAGPLEPPGGGDDTLMEPVVLTSSQAFVNKAKAAGANISTDFYTGTHRWSYWDREFTRYWPDFLAGLGLPNAPIGTPIS